MRGNTTLSWRKREMRSHFFLLIWDSESILGYLIHAKVCVSCEAWTEFTICSYLQLIFFPSWCITACFIVLYLVKVLHRFLFSNERRSTRHKLNGINSMQARSS